MVLIKKRSLRVFEGFFIVYLILRFLTTPLAREKRFEVQLGELWTVDCGLSTIIRSYKWSRLATRMIADNQIKKLAQF